MMTDDSREREIQTAAADRSAEPHRSLANSTIYKESAVPAETPWLHPALLQERAGDGVRCLTCERRCTLLNGQTGWCHTRQNREGTFYTLTYGLLSSLWSPFRSNTRPERHKPIFFEDLEGGLSIHSR